MSKVGIIMGSKSDLKVMKEAFLVFDAMDILYTPDIVSAHRTPEYLFSYAKTAKEKGYQIIIAGAGGAAHLPGMVASLTTLPIIGVPVKTSKLEGLDSLLSIVQMPGGVPVATMAIDGAKNAALFAVRILALHDEVIAKKLETFINDQRDSVLNDKGDLY